MPVLFDQAVPMPMRPFPQGHTVSTLIQRGWDKIKNGEFAGSGGTSRVRTLFDHGQKQSLSAEPGRPNDCHCRARPAAMAAGSATHLRPTRLRPTRLRPTRLRPGHPSVSWMPSTQQRPATVYLNAASRVKSDGFKGEVTPLPCIIRRTSRDSQRRKRQRGPAWRKPAYAGGH